MKKKILLGALIAIVFLSGIIAGGCGDSIAIVDAKGSSQTEQPQYAEMEYIHSSGYIEEFRDTVTGVHYFVTAREGITVRYNADGTVFVD